MVQRGGEMGDPGSQQQRLAEKQSVLSLKAVCAIPGNYKKSKWGVWWGRRPAGPSELLPASSAPSLGSRTYILQLELFFFFPSRKFEREAKFAYCDLLHNSQNSLLWALTVYDVLGRLSTAPPLGQVTLVVILIIIENSVFLPLGEVYYYTHETDEDGEALRSSQVVRIHGYTCVQNKVHGGSWQSTENKRCLIQNPMVSGMMENKKAEGLGRGKMVETGMGEDPRVRSIRGWISTDLVAPKLAHSCCISSIMKRKAFRRPPFHYWKKALCWPELWVRKTLNQKFLLPRWLSANSGEFIFDPQGSHLFTAPSWAAFPVDELIHLPGAPQGEDWVPTDLCSSHPFIQSRFIEHLPCVRPVLPARDGVEKRCTGSLPLWYPVLVAEVGPKLQILVDYLMRRNV